MKNYIKYLLGLFLLLMAQTGFSQTPEMADVMRSEGKIYVVVAIILIVLGGLILYLFLQDRKISRLEKMIGDKGQTK
jgi:uncharacterized transporter YbjL